MDRFDELNKRAEWFGHEIHAGTRADELAWYADWLKIDPAAILALMNESADGLETRKQRKQKLIEAGENNPQATIWITEMFRELASRTKYDLDQLQEWIDYPEPEYAPIENMVTGEIIPRNKPSVKDLVFNIQTGATNYFNDFIGYLKYAGRSSRRSRRTLKKV